MLRYCGHKATEEGVKRRTRKKSSEREGATGDLVLRYFLLEIRAQSVQKDADMAVFELNKSCP